MFDYDTIMAMETPKNEKRIEEIARLFYDSSLPYHNFDHALETIANSEIIIENCEKEKIPVDNKVVYYALLFHDAGYHENHLEKGFNTKEEYSAHLAQVALEEVGESEEIIRAVSKAILATQKNATFSAIEEKIVRASDLTSLADDYDTFKSNNEKFRKESEMLTGKKIPLDEWKNQTKKIMEFYLGQDIKITQAYWNKNGQSDFHTKARENLNRFLTETY